MKYQINFISKEENAGVCIVFNTDEYLVVGDVVMMPNLNERSVFFKVNKISCILGHEMMTVYAKMYGNWAAANAISKGDLVHIVGRDLIKVEDKSILKELREQTCWI